jgi:hypothetical protein
MARKKRFRKIKIEWQEMKTTWGLAYPDDKPARMVLDPRMDCTTLLDVASHETIHIVAPYLEEDEVELLGRQIGDVLSRLGFKRVVEE